MKDLNIKNETYQRIVKDLKEQNIKISYPITINLSNVDPYAYISCNYMGTGLKYNADELDLSDIDSIDPAIMKICREWVYITK